MSYCPDHDPILRAGFGRCGACGHTAYPDDAEWLEDGTILASYPAACEHARPGTWIIDPDALAADPGWCAAQTTTTGSPCRKRPRPGSAFCWWHQDSARRGA
jgi:hypothetical protein